MSRSREDRTICARNVVRGVVKGKEILQAHPKSMERGKEKEGRRNLRLQHSSKKGSVRLWEVLKSNLFLGVLQLTGMDMP